MRAVRGLVIGALCAAVLVIPSQPASASFSSPTPVSPAGSNATQPRQATDRQGDSTFVWAGDGPGGPGFQSRIRRADGSLTPVRTVATTAFGWSVLRVAVDDDGDGVIVWDAAPDPDSSEWRNHLYARRVSRSGGLGPIHLISLPSQGSIDTQVAVQPTGRAVITWNSLDGSSYSPWVRIMDPSGALGPARQVGAGPNAPAPTISIDRRGRGVLAWSNWGRVKVRRITPSGRLRPTHTAYKFPHGDTNIAITGIGLNRKGTAAFIAFIVTKPSGYDEVWSRRLGKTLKPKAKSRRISKRYDDVRDARMDTDLQGDTVVAWQIGYYVGVKARLIRHDGSMGKVRPLTNGGLGDVVLDDDGDGMVVTDAYYKDSRILICAARVRHTGKIRRPVVIAANDGDTDGITAGITPKGRTTIAWPQVPDGDGRVVAMSGR